MSATPLSMFKITGTRIEDYLGDNRFRIVIPDGITEIGTLAFPSYPRATIIESIVIPASVTKINKHAFFIGANLKTVTIPESVRIIEDSAFYNCPNAIIRTTHGSIAYHYAIKNRIPVRTLTSYQMAEELAETRSNTAPAPAPRPAPPAPTPAPPKPTPTIEPKRSKVKKDRTFYMLNLPDKYRHFLSEDLRPLFSQSAFSYYHPQDLKHWFSGKITLRAPSYLFAYAEDGVFFEFFTGRILGKRRPCRSPKNEHIDVIERKGYILTAFCGFGSWCQPISELSASDFLDHVKEYIPHKSYVADEMSRLLNSIDLLYDRLSREANAKKNEALYKEKHSRSWLNDFIDKK